MCPRYAKLTTAQRIDKLDVSDVGRLLNDVNQGGNTIQTMIFEPATLRVHLSLGPPPSSSRPLKTIDLKGMFNGSADATSARAAAQTTSR